MSQESITIRYDADKLQMFRNVGWSELATALLAVAILMASTLSVKADHLAPVDPLFPGANHSHQDHSGHNHAFANVPSINWSFTNFTSASLQF